MLRMLHVLVAASVLLASSSADEDAPQRFTLHGRVLVPQEAEADRAKFLTSTRVVLDGGSYVGFLKSDGTFSISDLPSASYMLEVYSTHFMFAPLRVDLSKKFTGSVRVSKADLVQGVSTVRIPYDQKLGLVMQAIGPIQHFEQLPGWSITSMIFNPMFMMMAMPMVMMYLMPKMMEGMDKEQLAEMQKQQAQMGTAQNFDLAETLASMTGGGSSSPRRVKKD